MLGGVFVLLLYVPCTTAVERQPQPQPGDARTWADEMERMIKREIEGNKKLYVLLGFRGLQYQNILLGG